MPASVTSPADVVNLALGRIGYKLRVGSLYDGSAAAKKALDVYAQTRDAVLRQNDFGFAEKIAGGTLSGQGAPAPWSFEYLYPTDCLRLRNMFNSTYLANKNNPLSNLYTVANTALSGKVIWTNNTGMTFVYTAQITDPSKWEALFVEMLATELGKRLGASLAGAESVKMMMEEEKMIVPVAESVTG